MNHYEIEKDGCQITCLERDMGWGINFGMNVNFPDWFTNEWVHEHREMVKKVALYTANKLEMRLLIDAVSFAKEIKEYGMELDEKDGVWVFYDEDKSAFIYPLIYSNKLDIRPFLTFSSVNEHGFTLTPGSFSDFFITTRTFDERLFGHTKDFTPMHFGVASVYLLNFCENLDNVINKKDIPTDLEEYATYNYQMMTTFGREITTKIRNQIDGLCAVNKSKRIDTLIVNEKNIFDYMRKHSMDVYSNVRGVPLLHTAISLGKNVAQVETFVKKYIERKRAN